MVAKVGEQLGGRLDDVDVLAVAFLRRLARGLVVGPLCLFALPDELRVVLQEDVQLARDDLGEAPTANHVSSR